MQKNIIKRQVATKAFQHNAKFYLSFPQQLPVRATTKARWDKVRAAGEGQSRAGTAGQVLCVQSSRPHAHKSPKALGRFAASQQTPSCLQPQLTA